MEFAWIKEQIPIIKREAQHKQLDFYDETEHPPLQPTTK